MCIFEQHLKSMRLSILFVLFTLLSLTVFSQKEISWNVAYNADNQTIEFTASIAIGWHLYSQHIADGAGPVATSFVFNELNGIKLKGKVEEPESIRKYDQSFEATLNFFEGKVTFTQHISKTTKNASTITGTITYMLCNDTMCLPPVDVPFTIEIPN
jgi:thiol:disulfide interchange protein DsbD